MRKIKVQFEATLPYRIKKEGKYYISNCPILDIYSQGDTEEKAKENLVEAISLFFISCFERGTLDEALKEVGFSKAKLTNEPIKSNEKNYLKIPIPLLMNNSSNKNQNNECLA